jgi:CheY-like chemotaxis protein
MATDDLRQTAHSSLPPYALPSTTIEQRHTTTETTVLKKSSRRSGTQKQSRPTGEPDSRSGALGEANKIAGFVAHELNNLLTVIQINTEFLLGSMGENPESAEELEEIQRASRRASVLARQLLASSRLERFDPNLAEAALRKQSPARGSKSRTVGAEKARRTAETILLVEDEAAVRGLTKKILAQNGYRVLEASDGAIALRLAAGHVGEIDLVLTDVAMPNLGGRGMVEELKELSPDMRVLFMSGYPKEEVFPDQETARLIPYLQKPFTGETLLSEVRTALGYAS